MAWRSWMMVLLSLVLLLSAGLSIPPTRTEAKGQPVVSPTPQIYKVKKGSIPLSADVEVKTVNVVDEATVKSVRHSLEKGDGKGQLSVILGRLDGQMKKALQSIGVTPRDLPAEGYVVAIGKDADGQSKIIAAGKDDRGTFYAVQTLQQIVRQGKESLPVLEIQDWPTMQLRGAIEGFYGKPWSHQDRLRQLDFYGSHKMNTYVYAPKDDPYHREKWREPYPEEKLEELEQLVDRAERNHVEFNFAISPGVSICYSDENELEALMDKAQAMWEIGVRSYSILLDDIDPSLRCAKDKERFGEDPNPAAAAQAYLLNRFNDEFIQTHPGAERLVTVPTDYWQEGETPYRKRFAELVDPDVIVYWTGIGVVAPTITDEDAEKTHQIFQHDLLIWDNYPVNDYERNRLFLGPLVGRDKHLTDHGVLGLTANPMNEAEASKIPLFTVAEYVWNPEAYDPQDSWERSLRQFGGKAMQPLKTFAENSYSSPINDKESPTLQPLIEAYWQGVEKGDFTREEDELIEELNRIEHAPDQLRHRLDNQKFLQETKPYLNKLELYGEAGKLAVQLVRFTEEGDMEQAWKTRLLLEEKMKEAKSIPQEVAADVMAPFLERAMERFDRSLGLRVEKP